MSSVAEASKALNLTEQTIRMLMDEGAINLGYVLREGRERKRYIVVPELLRKEVERIGEN